MKYLRTHRSQFFFGRSPHGERGLKLENVDTNTEKLGRSPHGERGLKLSMRHLIKSRQWSLPPRGARFETSGLMSAASRHRVAPPTGGAV